MEKHHGWDVQHGQEEKEPGEGLRVLQEKRGPEAEALGELRNKNCVLLKCLVILLDDPRHLLEAAIQARQRANLVTNAMLFAILAPWMLNIDVALQFDVGHLLVVEHVHILVVL